MYVLNIYILYYLLDVYMDYFLSLFTAPLYSCCKILLQKQRTEIIPHSSPLLSMKNKHIIGVVEVVSSKRRRYFPGGCHQAGTAAVLL